MTAAESALPAVKSSSGLPYVGLRPFGPEERDLFYGRESDAQFLVDKILSARVTLFYAPSGIGKSSLLRARVIPVLETEDCRVLYFDAWAGREPVSDLKKALSDIATSAGIPDPLAGAPTLAELAQLASGGQTMVLVLDQFEEFLINHASNLDPLRKELAALIRSQAVDARVVIALREEFLAAIEPFRSEILTLFHSTYRLESLPSDKVREAIVKPAERCGGAVETGLADRLINDLSETSGTDGSGAVPATPGSSGWRAELQRIVSLMGGRAAVTEPSAPRSEPEAAPGSGAGVIDLPMLQLICEHMWRAAPVVDGRRTLTLNLYVNQLGGKKRILDEHIRSRMPQRWRDRLFTATLMRFLAPPSGLKISYSAADLAAYSGLEQKRVEAELKRLSGADARILRQREFRDSVRFELQHDALIRHVTPWRDTVLAEAATLGRLKWAGAAIGLVIAAVAGERLFHWKEVRDNSDSRLNALAAMAVADREQRAGTTFETVASYLLFQERGRSGFEHLKRLLVEHERLLPDRYGADAGELDLDGGALPPVGQHALAMRFNSAWPLDVQSFNRAWSDVARQFSGRWGIPLPTRVRLIADPDFPRARAQFEPAGAAAVSIDVEAPERMALLSMAGAPEPAREFQQYVVGDLQALPALGEDWWAVPHWSLPAWRAAGLRVWPGSAYPALALRAKLDQNPTLILTSASADFLVQYVGQQFPCTAAEVAAHRGSKFRQDLVSWIGTDHPRPVLNPHLLFDSIADMRAAESPKQADAAPARYLSTMNQAMSAAWPQPAGTAAPCTLPEFDWIGFQGVEEWLPPLQPKIRVELSADLVRAWANEPQALAGTRGSSTVREAKKPAELRPADDEGQAGMSSDLNEALIHYRESFYRRRGIWLPKVTFVNALSESSGGDRRIRIILLDTQEQEARSVELPNAGPEGLDRLIATLDEEVSKATLAWVEPEYVGGLANEQRNLELLKTLDISVTDLKLLLRVVLSPEQTGEASSQASIESSVRDSDWLISSLVFWKAYYTSDKAPRFPELLPELAGRLRRLQAQRNAPAGAVRAGASSAAIQRGVQAIEDGRLVEAEKIFEQALNSGRRDEVERLFVERYAARWQVNRRARVSKACSEPMQGRLDPTLRIEAETLLAEPAVQKDRNGARNLAICLLSSMPPSVPKARTALKVAIASRYGGPDDWPALEAGWLGTQLLTEYDPLKDPGAVKDDGARFLTTAVRRLPREGANGLFTGLKGVCFKPGARNWCWSLLPAVADARPDAWTALDFAVGLSYRESKPELDQALEWTERARSLYAAQAKDSNDVRSRFEFWAAYARANALHTAGIIDGEPRKIDEAQSSISSLTDAPITKGNPDLEVEALSLAIRLVLDGSSPDRDRAVAIRDRGLTELPGESGLWSSVMFSALRLGDIAVVQQVVRDAYDKAAPMVGNSAERADLLFLAAVGGLLTEFDRSEWAARQFIRTDHPYAPLVSMLLSARTKGAAQDDAKILLNERWNHIDRTSWDRRLREGDRQAWYEMLVGYFEGAVPAGLVFDPLGEDSAFAKSPLAGLHVTRKALLTEAYFYDAVRKMAAAHDVAARESLERVVDLGFKGYVEYDMAVHLLKQGFPAPAASSPAR